MHVRANKKLVLRLLILLFVLAPISAFTAKEPENPEPFFSIAILAPNVSSVNNPWPSILIDQLPKIGIYVAMFDHTGWSQISPRTWGYPGPYPIPTYDEGGYDVLFVSWSFGMDYNPYWLLHSDSITPVGNNFYQYNSEEMDAVINNFLIAYNLDDRIKWAETIQAILYEDQPNINLMYHKTKYAHDENLIGWKSTLWLHSAEPMVEWKIPGKLEFHYAMPALLEDFHPFDCGNRFDWKWIHQIYNGLFERNSHYRNSYAPWIVEDYNSVDGLIYEITIKKDACWADGTNLTTDDVIYSYQLAYAFNDTEHYDYQVNWGIDAITKITDKHFTIGFNEPSFLQPNNLGVELLPKHIWESIDPSNHSLQAIYWAEYEPEKLFGIGPYKLASCDFTNEVIHLTRNDYFADWYGVEPFFEDIYFERYSITESAVSELEAGAVDMVDESFSLDYYLDHYIPGVIETYVDDCGSPEIAINMEHPYMGTGELCPIAGEESAKHIRKAISYILPRQATIDDIYEGIGTPGITQYPKVGIGFQRAFRFYEYDLNLAAYHMAMAGFPIPYDPIDDPLKGKTLLVGFDLTITFSILALLGGSLIILRKKASTT